jgi:hypothetical protein
MDREYQQLERALECDPHNLGLLDYFSRVSRRVGWLCKNRSIDQYIEDLYRHDFIDSYENGDNRNEFYKPENLRCYETIGPRIVSSVLKALNNMSATVRWNAAAALSFMGRAGVVGIPELIEHLEDEDQFVAWACRWALRNMAADSLPALQEHLTEHPERCRVLLDALSFMGDKASSAIPLIRELAAEFEAGGGFFDRAIAEIEGQVEPLPQAIAGVQLDFATSGGDRIEDFEWIAWCSELSALKGDSNLFQYVDQFWRPDRVVYCKPSLTISFLSTDCSKHALSFQGHGQMWERSGLLVQEIGRSYRIFHRVQSADDKPLTIARLLFEAYHSFQKSCVGNRWTIFDRFERFHGSGPDEHPVYQVLLN